MSLEARSVTFNFAEPEGPLTLSERYEASAAVPLMLRLVMTSDSKLFSEPAGTLHTEASHSEYAWQKNHSKVYSV